VILLKWTKSLRWFLQNLMKSMSWTMFKAYQNLIFQTMWLQNWLQNWLQRNYKTTLIVQWMKQRKEKLILIQISFRFVNWNKWWWIVTSEISSSDYICNERWLLQDSFLKLILQCSWVESVVFSIIIYKLSFVSLFIIVVLSCRLLV